jgi:hypothetical protein
MSIKYRTRDYHPAHSDQRHVATLKPKNEAVGSRDESNLRPGNDLAQTTYSVVLSKVNTQPELGIVDHRTELISASSS